MLKKIRDLKNIQQNNDLKRARKRLRVQAVLAVFTIAVTGILLFAMTTAWYSNVVMTSGLMFEAEAWDFEGEVAVSNEAIEAAPGDGGIVYLTVTNNSDDISAVTVNVTKQYMDPVQMQQRIYFYVDEPTIQNGENVKRQYLNDTNGHTYTVFSHKTMILSERVHTDSLLKWEWVYDVVGYYVRGSVIDGTFTELEYLRPVMYDYDEATYDENGNLATVDGVTTVYEFLATLTASDGYEGAYVVNDQGVLVTQNGDAVTVSNGYYPLSTKADNEVWIYLCSREEIEEHTKWDTMFGSSALEDVSTRFQARISVSAQQLIVEPVMVSSPQKLQEELLIANGGIVRLENSVTIDKPIELSGSTNAVLDLNGNSITCTFEGYAFHVNPGDDLIVINGSLNGDAELQNSAFYVTGGQVTLSNVRMKDMYMGVNIEDHKLTEESAPNSVVRIVDCQLTTEDITVKINGDGTLTGEDTSLVIQDSILVSQDYVGIMGNGNTAGPGQWGTDIQIVGSQVYGYYAAVYHPQSESVLTVNDSVLTGMTGVAIKGGSVYIIDSMVAGVGSDGEVVPELAEETLSGSGFQDTGDGIYVEANYKKAILIDISGDSQISANASTAYAFRVFPVNNYVEVRITGGTFSHNVSEYLEVGYGCQVDEAGNYTVVVEEIVG